jgi:hypothetical protein
MRSSLILFILCLAVICSFHDKGLAGEVDPEATVQNFYQASADGDVETMKTLTTGPFFKRRQRLIEENQGYADFLKDYYFGVNTEIVSTEIEDSTGKAVIVVSQTFQDGSRINTTLILEMENDGSWKINDELLTE